MASTERRDPLEEERERARQAAEGSQLPSERGLGGGAGETPVADVTAEGDGDEAVHPSLGSPPRREESRPTFRSSQLQHDEDKPRDGRPLRG
ncbi:MAG TPA: hypothetical protein VFC09_08845 [Candidatus Dormibacteraeota bacterium]|nr:hypothetical protein [Candidatus Dormibacteraeota bacterium]